MGMLVNMTMKIKVHRHYSW